jgi:transcription termination factor Rho
VLSRDLASARVELPVDLLASGTREDDLLLTESEAKRVRELRAAFATRSPLDVAAAIADEVPAPR